MSAGLVTQEFTVDDDAVIGRDGRSAPRIFLGGLTTLPLGSMEFKNLGNYTILEPLMELLREAFPGARVETTLQLSAEFCERFGVASLTEPRLWQYRRSNLRRTVADAMLAGVWRLARGWLPRKLTDRILGTTLLRRYRDSDLIIDFSGDRFGDNVPTWIFTDFALRLLIAKRLLRKPTVVICGSPGPFTGRYRRFLARLTLDPLDLVLNREDVSTRRMRADGLGGPRMSTAACPSVLFSPEEPSPDSIRPAIERIRSGGGDPVVGLILCDLNMVEEPINRFPRSEAELRRYVELVRWVVERCGARVCIMSHENEVDPDGRLVPGFDHRIIEQLLGLIGREGWSDRVFTLPGCYDAAQSRAIIREFEILISGRIHGAMQGMSQLIPTAIIDYGVGPPAHKLEGIAGLVGMAEFVCDPKDVESLIGTTSRVWNERAEIRERLARTVPAARESARGTASLLREAYLRGAGQRAAGGAGRAIESGALG